MAEADKDSRHPVPTDSAIPAPMRMPIVQAQPENAGDENMDSRMVDPTEAGLRQSEDALERSLQTDDVYDDLYRQIEDTPHDDNVMDLLIGIMQIMSQRSTLLRE